MINFIEHPDPKYIGRTIQNVAAADITFAFAFNFNTPGEKLTKYTCRQYNKTYLPIDLRNLLISSERIIKIRKKLALDQRAWITLNIAGNSLHSLAKHKLDQKTLDWFIQGMLEGIIRGYEIVAARSGGQTGADEAGSKATAKLGIPTTVCAPKGWLFRDAEGNDIRNEQLFKQRFNGY